ncbi:hypothetical protein DBB36_21200 [Flavobacterium sp. WLB]|uniref:AAA family ATPase n=1 Tax=unclassified Flavobacterium TaxID=196869 RepID=UPI0006ABAB4E|nr:MULTISPECIES: AAA family ATPase [unclassified Flavobacterium]KOP35689.1 hypothetical protein AKO67_23975 [Flavobacterium sp. VMW]OWU92326.1 hypothetical protein APR43_03555 [Flavobacterium sp. NLM]PUU67984.1 hypothetical protein DBB36_21200 [Flavobacterium sp. WLB]
MAKRIISVEIENCRAYCSKFNILNLPNGENVLIYGENGSGKSSLYKALNNYFSRSNQTSLSFVKNKYLEHEEGNIKIKFSDYDLPTKSIITGTEEEYTFGSTFSDNNVAFIQTAARIRGFLDYTDLLKVYLHTDVRPNLFDLIVLSLLGNHIPLSSGGIVPFKPKWVQLQRDLITDAYTRNDRCHKNGKRELPIFQIQLTSTLDSVFKELNRLLSSYFSELNIQIGYELLPLNFNYGYNKWEWNTTADLRLNVYKDGVLIHGDYSDYLNEARLSAIAICLYLASLLQNPSSVDLKLLYLDDVFIGLDSGNRIPILNILREEFSDYQKIISTYDRHWFELAKRQFEIYNDKSWSSLEIYVGTEVISGIKISKPILVKGSSHYEKAIRYLYDRERPDYPAAANYFRKSIEEIIKNFVPKYELSDADNTQLPEYKLTVLLSKTKRFLEKINSDTKEISKIIGLLQNLIHPLSHHEVSSQIYKAELEILENSIPKVKDLLRSLDISTNFKCVLSSKQIVKITYPIDLATGHFYYYELKLEDSLISLLNSGNYSLSFSKCYVVKSYSIINGNDGDKFNPRKNDPRFSYISLEDAINKIYLFLVQKGMKISKPTNYLTQIEYFDGTNWQPIEDLLKKLHTVKALPITVTLP